MTPCPLMQCVTGWKALTSALHGGCYYPRLLGLIDLMTQGDTSLSKVQGTVGPPEHFCSLQGLPVRVSGVVTEDDLQVVVS